ncbi:SDR family NAD(P)-dependent oxidoreductase [Sphingomonas xinjiangensis]|uniref:3-oxoacyl-[acyl-carrier protein] reductase n=1 Tax=Sphingomonas xinjiangensis TaxID=643568 RepID=A0A840YKR0_9SPHN|nr:SDR family oxidoreductase [Sphingomonas xinjiangensis]MBB5711788.1 3-oxoacyl-[acyl-carrier protein] reductase [Sphingomonas xinjiangensis]
MSQPLAGKVALITGGSRGIGAAIVTRLAREGADVVFSYSSSREGAEAVVAQVEALGRRSISIQADQAITQEVEQMVRDAHSAFGRLDIVVNSAGVFVTGQIDDPELDVAALDRQLDINVRAVVTVMRTAAPLMENGGSVVSIGTTGAMHHTPFAGIADYVASKAAVAAYTRSWARDLGPRNIRANTIQPGPIDTGMAPTEGPVAELMKSKSALGRYGKPEDVAAAVAFLVGPEATYITGATLAIDGGMTA